MPINVMAMLRKALRQLQAERGRIDHQIAALRGALDGLGGSNGRVGHSRGSSSRRRRRRLSATARRALSQRMKAYWAKRKAGKGKGKQRSA